MNRRRFLTSLAAAAAATRSSFAQEAASPMAVTINSAARGVTIPVDFVGLSYESAQLANPAFFSAQNRELIELFRGLSPSGNLRLGGGSSEFTTYSDADSDGPPPFEVFGADTSKTVKHGTTTTALALRNLRAFLDATNWSCLYGLNLGQGTKENAAAEAAAVHRILGFRLLAFQIGNEPDSFRNRYRPASYGPADYLKEWNAFHDAIVATTPGARFAGPDISNKLPYLTAFAAEAVHHSDVILLTAHYYAMGPAGSPDATLDQLLEPDPKLATIHRQSLPIIEEAIKTANLPFRVTEGNSCWDGGKPGVSDTLASALWCADTMLRFAQMGWCGFNLHGGGNGYYTPIAGSPSTGMTKRPEYFGIQFAQLLTDATFLDAMIIGANPRITTYALQRDHVRQLVVFNKNSTSIAMTLPIHPQPRAQLLTGPSMESKEGISLSTVNVPRSQTVIVPAQAAILYTL
jgi:hypothetical protein